MKIAIIDADLIGRKKHRFPNLACMKISGFYKSLGENVYLKLDYNNLEEYDKVFMSKVFTDTYVPQEILQMNNVEYGGTGFFYDKAPKLLDEIEHCMPDYHLYDEWVDAQISKGIGRLNFKYYLDYSIGFLTRGCFRQCEFCVNKNYTKVEIHSPLSEFVDNDRKKICLLDDNFFGCHMWKELLVELQSTNKPFQFKQGLDERLLTEEKCQLLFSSKYDGDYIFAFDNINDRNLIERKLKMLRQNTDKIPKFYVFCGFDRDDKWNDEFWKQDLIDLFERIKILAQYRCIPYIMRFNRYEESPYRGMYVNVASWCNQPNFFKKKTYREWCEADNMRKGGNSATKKYNDFVLKHIPELEKYFNIKFSDV